MDVTDTKPLEKSCSRCGKTKIETLFIPKRNICKECRNERSREKYKILEVNNTEQVCNICNNTKLVNLFIKNRKICKDCNNNKRRNKYENDEEFRKKHIQQTCIHKHNKVIERQKKKEEEIGIGNKKCSNCNSIKVINCFRYNRLKCKDCERDEPLDKLKRVIRSRIICALKNKQKHTVEYLGCSIDNYVKWLNYNDNNFSLENRGKEWHIDHVIPLSKFNLENEEEQLIAFNWRNTMPLSPKENLSKNCKIIHSQVKHHYFNLLEYHTENNIELPQNFIDLFAKHLVAGSP
jgi:uncharacterized protein (DUF983 family)